MCRVCHCTGDSTKLGVVHKVRHAILANFDPPPACHTLSHIPRPPKVRHTSRTPPFLVGLVQKIRTISLNFMFHMYENKFISVTSHALDPSPCHKLSSFLGPLPLDRDVLHGQPLREFRGLHQPKIIFLLISLGHRPKSYIHSNSI